MGIMNRIESVRNLAKRKVLEWHLTPPIKMDAVISSLGIEIIEKRNQLGIEAYSDLSENCQIVLNPEDTYYEKRRNFTLAHELGHFLIPWHNGDIKCNISDNYIKVEGRRLLDTQELEANIFASNFLMPRDWLRGEINKNPYFHFDELVKEISDKANTSVMACFYALENVLPSGYCYFVKRDGAEWWSFFASRNTYTVNWFSYIDDRIELFEQLATEKAEYRIGPYKVLLYRMVPCPTKEEIATKMEDGGSIESVIDSITCGNRMRIMPFMDVVLDAVSSSNYIAFLFRNNELERRLFSKKSPLCRLYRNTGYEDIKQMIAAYGFEFESICLNTQVIILYISEKVFEMPAYVFSDPNILLKQICYRNGFDKHMLQSINGVLASVNSMYGNECSEEELYNWCKYRFISDPFYEDFIEDEDFDRYIVSKIVSMRKRTKM